MATDHRHTAKDRNSNIAAQMTKPNKRWTLLYVGNKGRVLTLKRFKSFVLLTILLFAVSISISVFLFIRSFNVGIEKKELQIRLQSLQKQIKDLRHEKDIMMARLVLAESKAGKTGGIQKNDNPQSNSETSRAPSGDSEDPVVADSNKPDTQKSGKPAAGKTDRSNNAPADRSVVATTGKPAQTAATTPTRVERQSQNSLSTPKPGQPASTSPEMESESKLSVAIEGFNASNQKDNAIVQVRFKIKNTSSNSQRVSGYAIVVLKGETIDEHKWISIPSVNLVSGKPTGREKGYAFGISYFRNMRFKTRTPATPQEYNQAAVFVFTKAGELLLEQDFPVGLSPVKAPTRSPSTPPDTTEIAEDASQDDSR